MRNNDALTRDEIRAQIQQAIKDGNTDAFSVAFDEMIQNIGDDVQQRAAEQVEEMKQGLDTSVLTARGVRQLTSKEKVFYQKLIGAMKEKDPRQALNNLDVVMPETVIDAVFDLSLIHI